MQYARVALLTSIYLLVPVPAAAAGVVPPIDGYFDRQQVKGFGTFVDDNFHERFRALFPNNGFQNQFTGYHAGVDIEYTATDELAKPIPVRAVSDGAVVYVGDVAGYGGLMIVRHPEVGGETVTSLYGHVRLRDRLKNVGDRVQAGAVLAYLGDQFSAETSGARKHLHFGVHKGERVYLAGHEPNPPRLEAEWYNPNDWLRRYAVATPQATLSPLTAVASPSPAPLVKKPSLWDRFVTFLEHIFINQAP